MDEEEPDIEWLIEDYLEKRTLTVLWAPKDHFKSFVVIDWAMHIASGKAWCGHAVDGGLVVYIAGEGHSGMNRRFRAWAIWHKVNIANLPLVRSRLPMQVLDLECVANWQRHIETVSKFYNMPPKPVVIDTLATNFGHGDENSPTDVSRFAATLKIYLGVHFETSVLVVHHAGKKLENGPRGGSSLTGDADNVYRIEHVKDVDRPPPVAMKSRIVTLREETEDQPAITSLVMDVLANKRQQRILDLKRAGNPERIIAMKLGIGKGTVSREIERLRNLGLLKDDRQEPEDPA